MVKSMSVTLGDHFTGFINQQIEHGRFGSASEVVRAGLRLLEEYEAKVKTLQEALIAGEQSGQTSTFDSRAFLQGMHDKHVR